MDLQYCSATSADHPALLALMAEFYREEHLTFHEETAAAAISELLAAPAFGRVWLLRSEEAVAGYLVVMFSFILEFGGRQGFVDESTCAQLFRGRGFGRAALDFAGVECRKIGLRVLRLEVARSNVPAIRLYQRAGFTLHDRQTMTRMLLLNRYRDGYSTLCNSAQTLPTKTSPSIFSSSRSASSEIQIDAR